MSDPCECKYWPDGERGLHHHTECPLYKTEKFPTMWYFEETFNAWCPAPDDIGSVLDVFCLEEGEQMEIKFKRQDITDEEYDAIPED